MTNTLPTFTPFMLQRAATENGWKTHEYMDGMAREYCIPAERVTIHVRFDQRCAVQSAWMNYRPMSGWASYWVMLDHKVSGKRDIVMRWLAKDYSAGSEYSL